MKEITIPANVNFGSKIYAVDRPEFIITVSPDYNGEIIDFTCCPVIMGSSIKPSQVCGQVMIDGKIIHTYIPKLSIGSVVEMGSDGPVIYMLEKPFVVDLEDEDNVLCKIAYGENKEWELGVTWDPVQEKFSFTNRSLSTVAGHLFFHAYLEDNGVEISGVPMHEIPVISNISALRASGISGSSKRGTFVHSPVTREHEPLVPFAIFGTDEISTIVLREHALPVVNVSSNRRDLIVAIDKILVTIGDKEFSVPVNVNFDLYCDGRFDSRAETPSNKTVTVSIETKHDPKGGSSLFSENQAEDLAVYIDPIDPPEDFRVEYSGTYHFQFDGERIDCYIQESSMHLIGNQQRATFSVNSKSTSPDFTLDGYILKIIARKN